MPNSPGGAGAPFLTVTNLISESLVGRLVPLTSQCAGTVVAAGTMVAAVTVVRESFRLVRLSHDCFAKSGDAGTANATTAIAETRRLNMEVLP